MSQIFGREFYTVIPHDFGFKKMRESSPSLLQSHIALIWTNNWTTTKFMMAGEFVIDTPQKLKSKLEMVTLLSRFHYLDLPKMIK